MNIERTRIVALKQILSLPLSFQKGRLKPVLQCLLCLIFNCSFDVTDRKVCTCEVKRLWTDCKHSANTSSEILVVSLPSHKAALMISLCAFDSFWLINANKFLSITSVAIYAWQLEATSGEGGTEVCSLFLCHRINTWCLMLFDN